MRSVRIRELNGEDIESWNEACSFQMRSDDFIVFHEFVEASATVEVEPNKGDLWSLVKRRLRRRRSLCSIILFQIHQIEGKGKIRLLCLQTLIYVIMRCSPLALRKKRNTHPRPPRTCSSDEIRS